MNLVAVSKDPGEPVIPPGRGPRDACLHHRLETQLGVRRWVVHRIDRETSGVVVFARHAAAHRVLSLAFEHRTVQKTYVGFVAGQLSPPAGQIDVPLHTARRGRTRPAAPGEAGAREAVTDYAVRRSWRLADETVSLVELIPHQGRHHQIRAHLRAVGAPILFDSIYGRAIPRAVFAGAPCQRLALHAVRLVLPSPGGLPQGTAAVANPTADARPYRLMIEAPISPDLVALQDGSTPGGVVKSRTDNRLTRRRKKLERGVSRPCSCAPGLEGGSLKARVTRSARPTRGAGGTSPRAARASPDGRDPG